jgi:hypothetical protein
VHDYKAALLPYFDTSIKRYGTPFTFKIKPIGGIAVVQAQMFVGSEWFPRIPKVFRTAMDVDAIFSRPVFEFPHAPLAAIGGDSHLYKELCNIPIGVSDDSFKGLNEKQSRDIYLLNRMIPVLQVRIGSFILDVFLVPIFLIFISLCRPLKRKLNAISIIDLTLLN